MSADTTSQPAEPKTAADRKKEALVKALAALPPEEAGPFRTPDGQLFVRIRVGEHFEHWPLHSETFLRYVERQLFLKLGAMPTKAIVTELLRQFEGVARFEGEEFPVHLRVAEHRGNIILDLCDTNWRVVEISPSGWQIRSNSPVRFRRSPGMRPLPAPTSGGTVSDLLRFLNLGSREQELLCLSWLLAALRPRGPYPVLAIKGTQGSAKSTAQRVLRSLIDPSDSPLRTAPRDERDLMISAKHTHLIGFDNLSHISPWLSDGLCRLATGGGLATRVLYTDEKQILFNASRPVFINGISDLAERGDLLDRIVYLQLPPIPASARKNESDFWREFESAKPQIMGAILGVLVEALRRADSVRLPELPRMADFAIWATAAEEALGFRKGEFMAAYSKNRRESSLLALEFAPAASFIPQLVHSSGGTWEGTHGELLTALNMLATEDKRDPDWPKSARKMAAVLSRSEPNLAVASVRFTKLNREGGTGARRIRLSRIVPETVTARPVDSEKDFVASDDVTISERAFA